MSRARRGVGEAGRVIRAGPADAPYEAFVPHPLPPDLVIDADLLRRLSAADRAIGELAGLGRTLPNPHLLMGLFIRREAVLSSRIEGTRTQLADLYAYEAGQLVLPGMAPPPSADDAREVYNYVTALGHGIDRLNTLPMSLRLVREVHQHLMTGVRGEYATPGEFRRTQNWIGPPGCTLAEATFVPPPVAEMNDALAAWESYLHAGAGYPPLIRLALIHYQFEAIHPFLDGNGRVGRLLTSLLLVHWNLLPLPLLYLSAYFEEHRDGYYERLLGVTRRGEWQAWIAFFLDGVARMALDGNERARRLIDLQAEWRTRLAQAGRSATPLRAAEVLMSYPILTIPQAQQRLGVSYPTAKKAIERLVEAAILVPAGPQVYGRTYIATEILRILGGQPTEPSN